MISIAGFFTPSGSLTGKVFNFCTNKDYIMITKEQEAKLKALLAETAMYNAMIEVVLLTLKSELWQSSLG